MKFSTIALLAAILVPQRAPAVEPITGTAAIQLTKTVSTDGSCGTTSYLSVTPNTNVTYCYEVTNTGQVTFTTHALNDSVLGLLLGNFPYSLPPLASYTTTTSMMIAQTTTNTATWFATATGTISAGAVFASNGLITGTMNVSATSSDMALVEVDTDGDGIRDEVDPQQGIFDPTGCFYDETTGKVVAGGLVSISGPPGLIIGADGSNGCYQFNGVNSGIYNIGVTRYPPNCRPSTVCLDSGNLSSFTAPPCEMTGPICTLGDPNVGGFIAPSFACADNPFFTSLTLPGLTPDILNNNIPVNCSGAPAPTMGSWGIALTGLALILVGFASLWRMNPSTPQS